MVSNQGPSAYQPNALPLGQTGSHFLCPVYYAGFIMAERGGMGGGILFLHPINHDGFIMAEREREKWHVNKNKRSKYKL